MASSQTYYGNETVYQNTLRILMETTADVNFIFESNNNEDADNGDNDETEKVNVASQNDIVKIPAHKKVFRSFRLNYIHDSSKQCNTFTS